MKIRSKLLLIMAFPFILVYITTVWIEYNTQYQAAIDQATSDLRKSVDTYSSAIEAKFVSISSCADTLATSSAFLNLHTGDDFFEILHKNLETFPSAWGLTFAYAPYAFKPDLLYFAPYMGRTTNEGYIKKFINPNSSYNYFRYDWYLIPEITEKSTWTEPYYDRGVGNLLVCSYAAPIFARGAFIGVISIDISIDKITRSIDKLQKDNQEIGLLSSSGVFISHDNSELTMRHTLSSYAEEINIPALREFAFEFKKKPHNGLLRLAGNSEIEPKWLAYSHIPSTGWLLFLEQTEQSILAPVYKRMITQTLILGISESILFILVYVLLSSQLTKPLASMANAAQKVANGDLFTKVTVKNKKDEIHNLAQTFNIMVEKLRHTIDAQVKETTARQLAENANQAKNEFLANISHEIRTPMNAIVGFGYLFRKTEMSPKQKDYMDKIYHASSSLLTIINEILDYSNVESGKLIIENSPFTLSAILNDLTQLSSSACRNKGLDFSINVDSNVPDKLIGDPSRISQILRNIISNSIKFTASGGISVLITNTQQSDERAKLVFEIKDTGIGMSSEQLNNLFTSFSQADSSNTRKFGGIGIGLAISKRLTELMGGELTVESVLGQGTTLRFSCSFEKQIKKEDNELSALDTGTKGVLRRTEQPYQVVMSESALPPEAEHDTKANEIQTKDEDVNLSQKYHAHVLVVEDDEKNQRLTKELLGNLGISVDIANNGRVCVDFLLKNIHQGNPDYYSLVFMDLQMPVMDGYEATRIIRAKLALAHLPIIAMTAHALIDQKEQCIQVGMNDHIAKPIEVSALYAILKRHIPSKQIEPQQKKKGTQDMTTNPTEDNFLEKLDGFETAKAIAAVANSVPLYRKILQHFATLYKEGMSAKIDNLISSNDMNSLLREAHTIKGLAGSLGHAELQTSALNLETACKEEKPVEELKSLSQLFLTDLQKVVTTIEKALSPDEATEGSGNELATLLNKLHALLSDADIEAVETFTNEVEPILARNNPGANAEIKVALSCFDFDTALGIIDKLRS